jgi:hypothetical protein
MKKRPSRLLCAKGQSLVEFSMILPLVVVLMLGVVELGYALLDQHVVTKLTREGSNLISRDTSIQDALTALKGMSTRPANFSSSSKVIFSVLRKVPTVGAPNFDKIILYQRFAYGSLSNGSVLSASGGSFGSAPDYLANNSDNDTSLQVTNLPANLTLVTGGMLYVTEIYTTHTLITPFDRFGITVPNILYSIAYF